MGTNNPAGRLLALLDAAKKATKRAGDTPPGTADAVLRSIFCARNEDRVVFFKRFGQFLGMPALIRSKVLALPSLASDVAAAHVVWVPEFLTCFEDVQLTRMWSFYSDKISKQTLGGIKVCDHLLSTQSPEKEMRPDELSRLHEEVTELIREVAECEVDSNLKEYMLKHLRMVEAAVYDYRILGIEGFERAVGSTLVSVGRHPGLYESMKKSPEGSKFWDFMAKTLIVVGITTQFTQLGKDVALLLPKPDAGGQVSVPAEPDCEPALPVDACSG